WRGFPLPARLPGPALATSQRTGSWLRDPRQETGRADASPTRRRARARSSASWRWTARPSPSGSRSTSPASSAHALTIRRAISRFMVVLVGPVSFLAFAAVSLTGFAAWSDAGAGLAAAISLAAAGPGDAVVGGAGGARGGGGGLGGDFVRCAAGARRARLGGGGGLVGHDVLL